MYNRVLTFRTTFDSTLQLQLYTSFKQTRVAFYDCEKQKDAGDKSVKFDFKAGQQVKPGVFFQGCTLKCFYEFVYSMWMAPPQFIGASDFALR